MDNLTKEQRSYCMSRIRSNNTSPEILFRKYIWQKGLKSYRIHNKIVGKPDLYFPKQKIAVFIDGCFWHGCPKCFIAPKSQKKYWHQKINKNIKRDMTNNIQLKKLGIMVIRFWEHDIKANLDKCYLNLKNIYEKNI